MVNVEKLDSMTLREIFKDPSISVLAKDAIRNWDLTVEDFYDWTLEEIAEKKGWKSLKMGFTRLLGAASRGEYYFNLYSEEEVKEDREKETTNIVYIPSDKDGANDKPFIFLIPGGGLVNVWNLTEGWPIAYLFNELGYNVFIITYRVAVEATAVKDMADIARAFEIISSKKELLGVDPTEYITCGFSAGGYIAGLWNTDKGYPAYGVSKPKASILVYPVTSYKIMMAEEWDDEEEKETFLRDSIGVSEEEACNTSFEIPEHVEGFPPTAIFVTDGDDLVDPDNSKRLAKGLENAGIKCRLEVKPGGWHGFSDGIGMCMEGWPNRAIDWIEKLVFTVGQSGN
ncbi:MAG: alpha/beta hydrolase [Lachnospiraceae bacterium]|nr:alpha/beta hydrolase [Lachnospiraceae bacterium]